MRTFGKEGAGRCAKDGFFIKTDDGYKIIWYLGSTGYNSKLRNCFILECQFTIKQFASLATL